MSQNRRKWRLSRDIYIYIYIDIHCTHNIYIHTQHIHCTKYMNEWTWRLISEGPNNKQKRKKEKIYIYIHAHCTYKMHTHTVHTHWMHGHNGEFEAHRDVPCQHHLPHTMVQRPIPIVFRIWHCCIKRHFDGCRREWHAAGVCPDLKGTGKWEGGKESAGVEG